MIPFEEIDSRLDKLGKDRKWLVAVSGRSYDSIRAALAPNAQSKHRTKLLQTALSDAIEKEESAGYKTTPLPDRIYLEPSREQFLAWGRAYKASNFEDLDQWAIDALNRMAEQAKVVHFPQGKNNAGSVGKVAEDTAEYRDSRPYIDFRGGIAAGSQISTDISEEPMPVDKNYPPGHYVLRVFGASMEPKIPDQSLIVVKEWHDKGLPGKGTIVVYSDGFGSTLKEFGYRKAKPGEDHDAMGNVPVLKSINKAFPDVQTIDGGRIDAVFVEVLAAR